MLNKGYHSYRGRQTVGQRLLIAGSLLVLVLACAFIFLQRYVSYADDGTLHFDFPFFKEEEVGEEQTAAPTQPDMNLVIGEENEPEEPEAEPEMPISFDVERRLLGLTKLPTDGETLRDKLEQAGANGFVYTVRDNTGRVFYHSAGALRSAVNAPEGSQNLETLCLEEDIFSVARFNCLHDSYYAWTNMKDAGICQSSGNIWYDNISYHWLDADKEKTRRYVVELARECAQMGFDELMLEELCYPADGKIEKIDYSGNSMDKTRALELLLTELRQVLEPYGTRLTLVLDGRLLDNNAREAYITASGVKPDVLLPLVDAVYVQTDDPAAAQSALAALMGEQALPLVPICGEAVEGDNWYLAGS